MRPLQPRHTVIETVVSRKIDYSRFFLQLCVVFLMHSASSRPPKRRGSWKVSLSLHISKINSNRSRKHGPQLRMKYVYIPVSNCRCRLARTAHTCWSCARRCPASRARVQRGLALEPLQNADIVHEHILLIAAAAPSTSPSWHCIVLARVAGSYMSVSPVLDF